MMRLEFPSGCYLVVARSGIAEQMRLKKSCGPTQPTDMQISKSWDGFRRINAADTWVLTFRMGAKMVVQDIVRRRTRPVAILKLKSTKNE